MKLQSPVLVCGQWCSHLARGPGAARATAPRAARPRSRRAAGAACAPPLPLSCLTGPHRLQKHLLLAFSHLSLTFLSKHSFTQTKTLLQRLRGRTALLCQVVSKASPEPEPLALRLNAAGVESAPGLSHRQRVTTQSCPRCSSWSEAVWKVRAQHRRAPCCSSLLHCLQSPAGGDTRPGSTYRLLRGPSVTSQGLNWATVAPGTWSLNVSNNGGMTQCGACGHVFSFALVED